MTNSSAVRPGTDQPVDLSPVIGKHLMGKPLLPNYGMRHASQELKGADVQIRHDKHAGLRTKQNAAVRMFIEEQRTVLYLESRQGSISEPEYQIRAGELNRIRDKMLYSMANWAGTLDPKQGVMGTGFSREFAAVCGGAFNQAKDTLGAQVNIGAVPIGPVSGQKTEEQPIEVPINLKLSDLDVVEQPLGSGPLGEQSVLEVGLQQPDLPVFEPDTVETEENSDIHPVRSDEVSPPKGGDDPI